LGPIWGAWSTATFQQRSRGALRTVQSETDRLPAVPLVLALQMVQLRGGRGVVRRRRRRRRWRGPVGVMHHRVGRDVNRRGRRRSRAGCSTAKGPWAATSAAIMAPRERVRRGHGHSASSPVSRTDAGRRLAGGGTAAARRDHEHVVSICGMCDVAAVAVRQSGRRGKTRRAWAVPNAEKREDRQRIRKYFMMTINRSVAVRRWRGSGSDTRTRRRCCSDVSNGTIVTARRRSLVHTADERAMRAANDFVIRKYPAGRL